MTVQKNDDVEPDAALLAAVEKEEANEDDVELESDQGIASHYNILINVTFFIHSRQNTGHLGMIPNPF